MKMKSCQATFSLLFKVQLSIAFCTLSISFRGGPEAHRRRKQPARGRTTPLETVHLTGKE
jgi:hypothetical protein